mmetsp:Transcript_83142/g.193129  ORF Transcript_83142/g.193129 Transcript_83142/m.193129 type:complete len:310 (-) Transcript_83142:91-1020(-)
MRLSPEAHQLLEKRLKQAIQPVEILLAAISSTIVFIIVFYCCVFSVRYSDNGAAITLGLLCVVYCTILLLNAALKFRFGRPCRLWVAFAACAWMGLVSAFIIGNRYWHEHTIYYYSFQDMASYINIDPATDKGQSYMDAGTVYFKEGSYVLRDKAIAFKNGLTYCVAPIVRAPINHQADNNVPNTASGFIMPKAGTVDWWAVGTDCCGRDGNSFTCGDVHSHLARSGVRLLDDTARSMYLLAVQEWSATTGLPVRHPVFFEWTRDPIMHQLSIIQEANQDFWYHVLGCFAVSLLVAFILHASMQVLRMY